MCVPQRQRLVWSVARISASDGFRLLLQQRLRPHHHAGDAVAALRGLFFDKCPLQRTRIVDRAQPLDRRHLAAFEEHHGRDAREHRFAIHHHRAGAALAETAAELGAV